jgi:hypothetical protein
MPAYLVRTIDEHDLVGVFYASNSLQLAFLLDEVLDPDCCEYQLLGPGGIMWASSATHIPASTKEHDAEDCAAEELIPWAGASFTDAWESSLLGIGNTKWRKVAYTVEDLYGIDPESPDPDPPPRKSVRASTNGQVLPFRRRGVKL